MSGRLVEIHRQSFTKFTCWRARGFGRWRAESWVLERHLCQGRWRASDWDGDGGRRSRGGGWRTDSRSPEGHGRWRAEGWCLERRWGLGRWRASSWLGCWRAKGLGHGRAEGWCLGRLFGLGRWRASGCHGSLEGEGVGGLDGEVPEFGGTWSLEGGGLVPGEASESGSLEGE